MNIRKCENGHYYNGDRYKICPYCEESNLLRSPDTVKQENVKKEKADKKKEPKVHPVKKKYVEKDIRQDYRKLTELLIEWNISITTMESATAGQIASLITDTEGASAIFKGASITYSNETKIMQGVSAEVIHKYTVYLKETAEAMATEYVWCGHLNRCHRNDGKYGSGQCGCIGSRTGLFCDKPERYC